jgi:hypothetical protein
MERRPMVSSRTCRLRYKMNMPKVICVRIRPSEKYLSNGFECSLGQIGHVDADGPTLDDLCQPSGPHTAGAFGGSFRLVLQGIRTETD